MQPFRTADIPGNFQARGRSGQQSAVHIEYVQPRHRTPTDDPSAMTPRTAITTAIGNAVPEPPSPTNGAAAAPTANCATPNNADALPATAPCSASASAVALGSTRPLLATTTNSAGNTPGSPACARTTTNKAIPPQEMETRPEISSRRGPYRTTRTRLTWESTIIPSAFVPKMTLNICGETP